MDKYKFGMKGVFKEEEEEEPFIIKYERDNIAIKIALAIHCSHSEEETTEELEYMREDITIEHVTHLTNRILINKSKLLMLQLRQLTDAVLEENGFKGLNLSNGIAGNLSLVTTCGRPIITISGVEIPTRINKTERDYVFSLVEKFIKENKKDIKKIIKLKDNPFFAYNVDYGYNMSVGSSYDNHSHTLKYSENINVNYHADNGEICIKADGASFEEMNIVISKKQSFVKIFKDYIKDLNKESKEQELIKKLSSCRI